MQIGSKINLFRNVNLKKIKYPLPKGMKGADFLEDPSKGNVFTKREGVIVKIYQVGDVISESDISRYSRGNTFIRRSFEMHRSTKSVRVVAEFFGEPRYKYRIISEFKFKKNSKNNMFGYAEVLPNSVQFILEN